MEGGGGGGGLAIYLFFCLRCVFIHRKKGGPGGGVLVHKEINTHSNHPTGISVHINQQSYPASERVIAFCERVIAFCERVIAFCLYKLSPLRKEKRNLKACMDSAIFSHSITFLCLCSALPSQLRRDEMILGLRRRGVFSPKLPRGLDENGG